MLTALLLLPIAGAILIALLPRANPRIPRALATLVAFASLCLSVVVFGFVFNAGPGVHLAERYGWLRLPTTPAFNVDYSVGVDGLSAPMVLLTGILFFLAVVLSWRVDRRVNEYFALLLTLQTGILGVFLAQDFFLFFLFWELELFPMYLLIGTWGGERRSAAAMKFLIFTLAGSAFMLVGILTWYYTAGVSSFDFATLAAQASTFAPSVQALIFFFLFVGYAVKLPVVPLHTWLPEAYSQASAPVALVLAGVLSKLGAYAILRVCAGMLPEVFAPTAPLLTAFAVVNILYGGFVAIAQRDLGKVVAYSSISHMGYILLGAAALNEIGMMGAQLQMVSHALITGSLFLAVGALRDRLGTADVDSAGGIAGQAPVLATLTLLAGLASLGLPFLAGFNAEILVFLGAFKASGVAAVAAAFGVVLAASYILIAYRRAFFGPAGAAVVGIRDLRVSEAAAMGVLAALIIGIGVYPSLLTRVMAGSVASIVARLTG